LRDLVRAREAAKRDQLRARHRLSKFLLRHGRRPTGKTKAWGHTYMRWVRSERFEHAAQQVVLDEYLAEVDHAASRIQRLNKAIDEAVTQAPPQMQAVVADLQAFRGVAKVTAVTVVCEVGQFSRFSRPPQLMAYAGVVPGEHSSGERTRRGAITKTGNAHLRRILFEAAWSYRHRPAVGPDLLKRQTGASAAACQIGMKAQKRLFDRYRKLGGAGKPKQVVVTAIARELLGFLWAAGCAAEAKAAKDRRAA
jgi:transposase